MADLFTHLQSALGERYAVERELGRGGMATVYLARDLRHKRPVALKVLHPELAYALGADRFLREIEVAANLSHPHILPLFDSGEADDLLYYVMPYVEGESLRDRLTREMQLPLEDALQIGQEVADALAYAHRQGVIHRDIKPENILLSGGHALVADFGIARAVWQADGGRLTETGMAVGTAAYMSPEQAAGRTELDGRSDLYSLACVLYELLAGEPPFSGRTPQAVIAKRFLEPVPHVRTLRESVPEALDRALTQALAKAPADRFATLAEFADAIGASTPRQIDAHPSLGDHPHSHSRSARRLSRRAVVKGTLVIAGFTAIGAALIAIFVPNRHPPSNLRRGPAAPSGSLNPARLAVLYFQNETGSQELAYVPDALTEALIAELAQVKGLDVVSRHGSALYRDAGFARDSIARALQVGTLIDGSVERLGERVRVAIRLVDGESGADFGRTTLERPADALLTVRDSVVQRAAALLRTWLGEEVRLRTRRISTTSTVSWSLLQRAENVRKEAEGLVSSDPAMAQAVYMRADSLSALSEQADPSWVEPVVFRSQVAYRISRFTFDPKIAGPWIERGLGHAGRALALTSQDPAALAIRGTLEYWKWLLQLGGTSAHSEQLFRGARADLELAVKLEPSLAQAWGVLSHLYGQIPDLRRAKLAAIRAYEEDTYLEGVELVLFRLFASSFDLEQYNEAGRWCRIGGVRFPDNPRFTECRLWLLAEADSTQKIPEAWRLVMRLAELSPVGTRAFFKHKGELFVAALLAKAGLADSARHVIEHARATDKDDPNRELPYYEAKAYLLLGDRDDALQSLKSYFAADPNRKVSGLDDPWFRELKGDPRFEALVRK